MCTGGEGGRQRGFSSAFDKNEGLTGRGGAGASLKSQETQESLVCLIVFESKPQESQESPMFFVVSSSSNQKVMKISRDS